MSDSPQNTDVSRPRELEKAEPPRSIGRQLEVPVSTKYRYTFWTMTSAIVFYGLTCATGVLWQDSAMFQHRVRFFDIRGESGLPLAHPLYVLLASAFTTKGISGNHAHYVNLFSSLCGAITLTVTILLLLNITKSRIGAIVGTISLAVSHTFWTHSVIAEVYNLYALGLVIELFCVDRFLKTRNKRWFIAAVFVNGLNISNHLLAILHAPVYAVLLFRSLKSGVMKPGVTGPLAIAFLAGASPYLWLIGENIVGGQGVVSALSEALVGPAERANKVLETRFSFARQAVRTAQYFAMNFPTPIVLLAIVGAWHAFRSTMRRDMAWVLAGVFLIDFVFAFRYPVPDQFVFFTPAYVVVAILIGLGAADIWKRVQRVPTLTLSSRMMAAALVICALLPIGVYAAAPTLMRGAGFSIGAKREIPFRDTLAYFIQPWKINDHSAQQFADAALAIAAPDGLLYADTTIKNVLVYVRDAQGKHAGVTLTTGHDTIPLPPVIDRTPEAVEPFVKAGKAYICSDATDYVPDWIRERWDLEPAGIIFKIVPKKPR